MGRRASFDLGIVTFKLIVSLLQLSSGVAFKPGGKINKVKLSQEEGSKRVQSSLPQAIAFIG